MTFQDRCRHALREGGTLDLEARRELNRRIDEAIHRDVDLDRIWELLDRDSIPFLIDDIAEYLTTRFPREERP